MRRSSRPTPSTASSLGTCSATPPSGLCYHICYFDFVGQVGLKSRDFVDLWHCAPSGRVKFQARLSCVIHTLVDQDGLGKG